MSKNRNAAQLQETLDKEMGWRIKEIAAFRMVTKTQEGEIRSSSGQERHLFMLIGRAS